ncbi:hypothetical protein J4E08_02225 [Sagittula sp. NFXS13]
METAMASRAFSVLTALSLAALTALPVMAQEDASDRLSIELNSVEPQETGCRMSFVVLNGHEVDLSSAVFEAVLFDAEGAVERMTLFDFGALPSKRTRVRQFVVPQLACDNLGQILINGAQTCEAEAEGDFCIDGLDLKSRIDIRVIG